MKTPKKVGGIEMSNDRDRLIELFSPFADGTYNGSGTIVDGTKVDDVVDHLLANGVIVPQCNFKDTIYRVDSKGKIYDDWELIYIQVYPDEILYIDDSDNYFTAKEIGKTVFLTKEEAEKKLHKLETDTNVGSKKEREG